MEGRYKRVVDLVELTGLLQSTTSGMSIDDISARFEVSRRTAERMLAALRERFPDLEPVRREGRKFWRLPGPSGAHPGQLAVLSERVSELETEAMERQEATGQLYALVQDVLGGSAVGIFVLDSDFRVVWLNRTLEIYLGIDRESAIGRDKRTLIRSRIRNIFEKPDEFEERVLDTYDDNTYIQHFQCRVVGEGSRKPRTLQHWSQPISSGLYAGGRIEHYVEVPQPSVPNLGGRDPQAAALAIARQIEQPLAELQRSVEESLADSDLDGAKQRIADLSSKLDTTIDQLRSLREELD